MSQIKNKAMPGQLQNSILALHFLTEHSWEMNGICSKRNILSHTWHSIKHGNQLKFQLFFSSDQNFNTKMLLNFRKQGLECSSLRSFSCNTYKLGFLKALRERYYFNFMNLYEDVTFKCGRTDHKISCTFN